MKKRVFLALLIPKEIKNEISQWQSDHKSLPVRWIRPENLHITLIPPWYAGHEEIEEASSDTMPVIKEAKKFSVNFDKVLFGPPGRMARLIWAEGQNPREFIDLKAALEKALAKFSHPENRPPKLHLTIARFQPGSINPLPELDEKIDWSFEANEIAIMESVLKRTGAEYAPLKIFHF